MIDDLKDEARTLDREIEDGADHDGFDDYEIWVHPVSGRVYELSWSVGLMDPDSPRHPSKGDAE